MSTPAPGPTQSDAEPNGRHNGHLPPDVPTDLPTDLPADIPEDLPVDLRMPDAADAATPAPRTLAPLAPAPPSPAPDVSAQEALRATPAGTSDPADEGELTGTDVPGTPEPPGAAPARAAASEDATASGEVTPDAPAGDEETAPDGEPADETGGRPPTVVRISHGDLRFARHHVLVGHYPGSTLIGGEAALDDLLDGRLGRAALLGIYPGPLETCQVFTDPEEWTRPPGAVVAGLGPIGGLSAASLARAVAHAALTAALSNLGGASAAAALAAPRRAAPDPTEQDGAAQPVLPLCLSTLLIGTGSGGLPVRDSVQALLTGIQRANDRLADTDLPVHITELEIIELWQDRALQAVAALESSLTSGELAESFTATLRLEERPGRQSRLLFQEPPGWWQQVRVRSEADGGLTFEASVRRAGTPTRTVPTQRALVDRLVESLVDSPTPDPLAARTLFELLFPNELKAQAPDTDNLVLVVDRGSAHYPWELLDDHDVEEDREPLGVRRGLVRQLEGSSMRSHVLSATNTRALVVGDTSSGLSALPAAQQEGRDIATALRDSGFQPVALIGESGTKVVQSLFDGAYRVVHLAGHGVYRYPLADAAADTAASAATAAAAPDTTVTGVVLGNGMYLTAGEIGQMRQVPELVFVNCCHLGSIGQGGPSSQAGVYHRLAASFATELIDIGVRAVVACGWAVDDTAASTFALTFYAGMLAGDTFGEAIAAARWQTWNDHQEVNTWGAYQCYGDPDYRLNPDPSPRRDKAGRRPPASAEQARVEIENLSRSVEVSRNTKAGLKRLAALYEALTDDDRDDGDLQVLIARTYNKFGDFARATEYYEGALRLGGDALTVRDFEVWIDQMVRSAAFATGEAVPGAVDTIEGAIGTLRGLLDDPGSLIGTPGRPVTDPAPAGPSTPSAPPAAGVDRLWRVASAYKRLALVTCPERPGSPSAGGDWSRTHDALVEASTWYAAARDAAGAADRRRHGALANWLAAELALRWRPVDGREPLARSQARELLRPALRAAREEAYLAPTFWTVAVFGDLTVLDALWRPRRTDVQAQAALDLYRRASELGSEEQLRQVRDQVDFLIVMSGGRSRSRAAFLHTLRDGLAALDAEVGDDAGVT